MASGKASVVSPASDGEKSKQESSGLIKMARKATSSLPCQLRAGLKRQKVSASPAFGGIPMEILSMITDSMDTVDLAALAMTCKSLHFLLNPEIKEHLTQWDGDYVARIEYEEERMDFLERLARDSNGLSLCHYHRTLHPCIQIDRGFSRSRQELLGETLDVADAACIRFEDWKSSIGFHDVQMAILRAHARDRDITESLLYFSSDWLPAEVPLENISRQVQWSDWFKKTDVTPLISSDKLFLHICQRKWLPVWFPRWHILPSLKSGLLPDQFRVCQHTEVESDAWEQGFCIQDLIHELSGELNWTGKSVGKAPSMACTQSPRKCRRCPLELAMTIFDHAHEGIEIVIDVWLNLGPYRSLNDVWRTADPKVIGDDVSGSRTSDYPGAHFQLEWSSSALSHPSSHSVRDSWSQVRDQGPQRADLP